MPLLGLTRSLNRNLTHVLPWSHREVLMTHVNSERKSGTGSSIGYISGLLASPVGCRSHRGDVRAVVAMR